MRKISTALKHGDASRFETLENISIDSRDEFGRLAEQFNLLRTQLIARIDLANKEVREANRQLEERAQELRRVNEQLKQLSITDTLTGLYNRRHFENQLEIEAELSLRTGAPTSLIFMDLDRFKDVNDHFGHDVGDDLLKHVSQTLGNRARRTDILGRFGGDEFYILARRSDRTQAENLVKSLRQNLATVPLRIGTEEYPITASFGIATIPGKVAVRSGHQLFLQADDALYAAKSAGRDGFRHFETVQQKDVL